MIKITATYVKTEEQYDTKFKVIFNISRAHS